MITQKHTVLFSSVSEREGTEHETRKDPAQRQKQKPRSPYKLSKNLPLLLKNTFICNLVLYMLTCPVDSPTQVNGTELERNLYHDPEHASSLLVERRGRDVQVVVYFP